MTSQTYLLPPRPYSLVLNLDEELHVSPKHNYLFELSFLGALSCRGEKAQDFLQGQLSCDLKQINSESMRPAALCNLKGRVLALIDVIHWNELNLILPKDLIAQTQKTLSAAASLSRVCLEENNSFSMYGLYLNDPDDNSLPPYVKRLETPYQCIQDLNGCSYYLGDNLYILLTSPEESTRLVGQFSSNKQGRGSLAWHYLELQQGRVQIYPDTRGLFLPHRLNLHKKGYLSFDKGCYKGQEIIARIHYRGHLKQALRVFTIHTQEELKPGQRLYNASGLELGELIDFSPLGNAHFLIAVSILLNHPSLIQIEGQQNPVSLMRPKF